MRKSLESGIGASEVMVFGYEHHAFSARRIRRTNSASANRHPLSIRRRCPAPAQTRPWFRLPIVLQDGFVGRLLSESGHLSNARSCLLPDIIRMMRNLNGI